MNRYGGASRLQPYDDIPHDLLGSVRLQLDLDLAKLLGQRAAGIGRDVVLGDFGEVPPESVGHIGGLSRRFEANQWHDRPRPSERPNDGQRLGRRGFRRTVNRNFITRERRAVVEHGSLTSQPSPSR